MPPVRSGPRRHLGFPRIQTLTSSRSGLVPRLPHRSIPGVTFFDQRPHILDAPSGDVRAERMHWLRIASGLHPGPPSRTRYWNQRRYRRPAVARRSEEHTSELQSLMRISYAVFCLKKKKKPTAQKSSIIIHTKKTIKKMKQNICNYINKRVKHYT